MSVDDHPRALRVDPLPGNQRWDDVPCSPFRLVCFPLRFFWRDIVAPLLSLPHRGRTPYGLNPPSKDAPPADAPCHHMECQRQEGASRSRVSSRSEFGPSRPPPRGRARGPPHVGATPGPSWTPGPGGGPVFGPPQAPFLARSSPSRKKVEKTPPFWGGAVQSCGGVGGLRPLT